MTAILIAFLKANSVVIGVLGTSLAYNVLNEWMANNPKWQSNSVLNFILRELKKRKETEAANKTPGA